MPVVSLGLQIARDLEPDVEGRGLVKAECHRELPLQVAESVWAGRVVLLDALVCRLERARLDVVLLSVIAAARGALRICHTARARKSAKAAIPIDATSIAAQAALILAASRVGACGIVVAQLVGAGTGCRRRSTASPVRLVHDTHKRLVIEREARVAAQVDLLLSALFGRIFLLVEIEERKEELRHSDGLLRLRILEGKVHFHNRALRDVDESKHAIASAGARFLAQVFRGVPDDEVEVGAIHLTDGGVPKFFRIGEDRPRAAQIFAREVAFGPIVSRKVEVDRGRFTPKGRSAIWAEDARLGDDRPSGGSLLSTTCWRPCAIGPKQRTNR